MSQTQTQVQSAKYIVFSYEDKQFDRYVYDLSMFEYPRRRTIYGDIPKEIKDVFKQDEMCSEAPIMFVYSAGSYPPGGGSMVLNYVTFTIVANTEALDVPEEAKNIIEKYAKEIREARDAVEVLNKFVELAEELRKPYITRGIVAKLMDTGGDYPKITVTACYLG